jgi:hypothetical protein
MQLAKYLKIGINQYQAMAAKNHQQAISGIKARQWRRNSIIEERKWQHQRRK